MSPSCRAGLAAAGLWYVLDVSSHMTVWPQTPIWSDPPYQGLGSPRTSTLQPGQRRTVAERSLDLPPDAWQEVTVAQGPRTYRCHAQRVRVTARRRPGPEVWLLCRQNLDGSEQRHYLSNAPAETPLETLACVGGSRWHIETECETRKRDVGMDAYETRTWPGWHHHITMCLLASAFLLSLQQEWGGKRCPASRVHSCIGWCVRSCPGLGADRRSC